MQGNPAGEAGGTSPLPEASGGRAAVGLSADEPLSESRRHVEEARRRAHAAFYRERHYAASAWWADVGEAMLRATLLAVIVGAALWGLGHESATAVQWIVVLGLALAVGEGILVGTTALAQIEFLKREIERERDEIAAHPEQERTEIEALYRLKGFRPPLLTQIVDHLTSDRRLLLRVMLEEELGLFSTRFRHPLLTGGLHAAAQAGTVLLLAASLRAGWYAGIGVACAIMVLAAVARRLAHEERLPGAVAALIAMAGLAGVTATALARWLIGGGAWH